MTGPVAAQSPSDRLALLQRGSTAEEALAFFDTLPPVTIEELRGRWRGSELPTGHPLEGLLEHYGWYGKEFIDAETVHPLLFQDAGGAIVTIDPRKLPMKVAPHVPRVAGAVARRALSVLDPVIGTDKPRARLRNVEYRGKIGATMIYDHLPINDVFRRVDDDTVLGAMDRRGDPRPFFFVLRRDK
jgi:hypothetical protein